VLLLCDTVGMDLVFFFFVAFIFGVHSATLLCDTVVVKSGDVVVSLLESMSHGGPAQCAVGQELFGGTFLALVSAFGGE